MGKVTQASIAKRLGISRQTVGCALGFYTGSNIKLSPELRERIIRTAEELGYRPNRLAQLISGRRSGVIGVISFGGISQMAAQTTLHLAKAIQKAGFQLMLHEVSWYQQDGIEAVEHTLIDNKVEGIILSMPTDWLPAKILENFRKQKIPLVALGGGIRLPGVPHIHADHEHDSYQLIKRLLDEGYRSLAYLDGRSNLNAAKKYDGVPSQRFEGFQRAIEERGGTISDAPADERRKSIHGEVVLTKEAIDWSDPYAPGEAGMRSILQRKKLPEVVVCANDDWAAGALKACGEAGIRVPEQIAITGNDGTLISGYGYVPLTTIIQPLEAMADKAVETLLLLINGEPLAEDSMTIAGTIAWRRST